MSKKFDFNVQNDAIQKEIANLCRDGFLLPDLTEGYQGVEDDFGKRLPVSFEEAYRIIAATKRNYFRLKTKLIEEYDTDGELRDLQELFSKYRRDSIIGCFPYISGNYPWPVDAQGKIIPPMLQLDLSLLRSIGEVRLGDGLLQVFASKSGELIRFIPREHIKEDEIDNKYLVDQGIYESALETFATTHRIIKGLYHSGTIVNQGMASSLKLCLDEFVSNLNPKISKNYKKLATLISNIVHDDSNRGSYLYGWGWDYINMNSYPDCFMQLEGPEFDFIHLVFNGCGCIRLNNDKEFSLIWSVVS